jgi:hypothetical protein
VEPRRGLQPGEQASECRLRHRQLDVPDIARPARLGMPDLALGNDDFGPEPGSLVICRPAATGNGKSGAVETGLGPQPKAYGGMPAQLTPLELG